MHFSNLERRVARSPTEGERATSLPQRPQEKAAVCDELTTRRKGRLIRREDFFSSCVGEPL